MSIEQCFEDGKLRRERPDLLKAMKSLSIGEAKLKESEELAKAGFKTASLIAAYASMFHAGRALLFKDGIVEKSHYCLITYLREKYAKTGKMDSGVLTVMDAFREERHDLMYSLEEIKVREDETRIAIENAKKMLENVRKLVK